MELGRRSHLLFLMEDIPSGAVPAIYFPQPTHAKTLINTDTLLHDHNQPLSAFFLSAPNRKSSDYKHTAIIYEATAKYPLQQPGSDRNSWRSWPWRANDHWELLIVLWQCQKCKRNISFEMYKLERIDAISFSLCLSCKISYVWVTELSTRTSVKSLCSEMHKLQK